MTRAFVGIGTNLEPVENARRAVARFADAGELVAVSTFYRTPATRGGPAFVNGVVALRPAERDAPSLVARLRALEAELGRARSEDKHAPRTIDLDLLAWPGRPDPGLPHPDVERYDFVALPLSELDPRLPGPSRRPVRETARSMSPRGMRPLPALTRELRALAYHARRSLHA